MEETLKKLMRTLFAALFLVASAYSIYSGGEVVPGEYLVEADSSKVIRRELKEFQVQKVKKIRTDLYLVKIKKDPGLKTLEKLVRKSEELDSIQPNYVYRAQGVQPQSMDNL